MKRFLIAVLFVTGMGVVSWGVGRLLDTQIVGDWVGQIALRASYMLTGVGVAVICYKR